MSFVATVIVPSQALFATDSMFLDPVAQNESIGTPRSDILGTTDTPIAIAEDTIEETVPSTETDGVSITNSTVSGSRYCLQFKIYKYTERVTL